jgi:Acyl-CoA oxidase
VDSIFKKKGKRFAVQLSSLSDGRIKAGLTGLTTGMLEVTIASRFTCVHRQYGDFKYEEQRMLDYPVIQNSLIPTYAKCLVPYFMGIYVGGLWSKNYKEVFNPASEQVKEMHALISIYKPICSWYQLKAGITALHVTEVFGLQHSNGICGRINDAHVNATWEGDNTVLLIQTTQFILSNIAKYSKGTEINFGSLSYLVKWLPRLQEGVEVRAESGSASEFENLDVVLELLEYRAAKAAMEGALEIQLGMVEKTPYDAFNSSLPFANNKGALFYGELFMFNQCREAISKCGSLKNADFLSKILAIYGLFLVKETSEFYLDYLNSGNISKIETALLKLYD